MKFALQNLRNTSQIAKYEALIRTLQILLGFSRFQLPFELLEEEAKKPGAAFSYS